MAGQAPYPQWPHPPANASRARTSSRARLASRALVVILAGLFVLGAAGFVVAALSTRPEPSPGVRDAGPTADPGRVSGPLIAEGPSSAPSADPDPTQTPSVGASTDPSASPDAQASGPPPDPSPSTDVRFSPSASGSPSASTGPPALTRTMPVVPVAGFWSTRTEISRQDLRSAIASGSLRGFERIAVLDELAGPLEESLGIRLAAAVRRGGVADVERVVARGGLGLLPASDVSHRVRALALDGRSLFGNDRVGSIDAWPLSVQLDGGVAGAWSQKRAWVLVAGGDSFTDRGIYERVVRRRKGIDYPFDGGTARVTGHYCCGPVIERFPVPSYELTGNKGIVRRLVSEAELAIVNHEQPVTDAWSFHLAGTRFSGKPELTEIFKRAGIDWMSLANNHIKDYGSDGIADTRRILKRYGIRFGGAGANLAQARRISYLDVAGTRIAIVPCVDVAPVTYAGAGISGATPCKAAYMRADLRTARRNADFVIAFPHWGVEYSRKPTASQRAKAASWVKAGADLVLGAHSHVAGAIEEIDGKPVFYSLGNFIFDQNWSTPTMESFVLEATFHGDRLVQLSLHPFLQHDQAQPNLLDPRRDDGRRLMLAVKRASADWLDW